MRSESASLRDRPSPDPDDAALRLAAAPWPAAALAALARLREGGHQAVLVGGSVRDVLLGRPPHHVLDVATDLTPDRVSARFERIEPVGIAHGTVMILLADLMLECTTFRREGAYPDARHPETVTFTRSLEEDLARRDLTVNALAWDPGQRVLTDAFGGLEDLARGVLRAVGDPEARFREDALRPVRVARFAATLEMTPEPATRAALARVRDRAARVAVERVRAELERTMEADRPSIAFELLREAELLDLWMPELTACYGVTQNRWHAHDVWTHSLLTCDAAPADKPAVRWAALLHDIGKPGAKAGDGPAATFHGHAALGAELADWLLERLRFPNDARGQIVHLVREHMFEYRPEWTDAALRRWLRRVGLDSVADLFDLRIADVIANPRHGPLPSNLEEMRRRIEALLAGSPVLTIRDLAVDGADVMRTLGIPPGPAVGAVLAELLEEATERPEHNQREWMLERIRERGIPSRSEPHKA